MNVPTFHSLETIYDALDDRQRRLALYPLRRTSDGFSDVDALVERVVEWEADEHAGDDHADGVARTLHHVHLPKLTADGVVDYDWRTEAVRYRPGGLLEAHPELAERRDLDE